MGDPKRYHGICQEGDGGVWVAWLDHKDITDALNTRIAILEDQLARMPIGDRINGLLERAIELIEERTDTDAD